MLLLRQADVTTFSARVKVLLPRMGEGGSPPKPGETEGACADQQRRREPLHGRPPVPQE